MAVRNQISIAVGAVLLLACGPDSGGVQGVVVTKAGEWETRLALVSAELPGIPAAQRQRLLAELYEGRPERSCLRERGSPEVGERYFFDGCTYRRVADTGAEVDREAICPAAPGMPERVFTVRGQRTPETYDYLVTITSSDGHRIAGREVGRLVGPCPS